MTNPYENLPARAFWRTGVADRNAFEIDELWDPKFRIAPRDKVATAGSCFAQHIGRALRERKFKWLDAEPAPRAIHKAVTHKHNYGVFSFRTGNIYTAALMRQWMSWALGHAAPPDEAWVEDGRCYDPFRPAISPDGFDTPEEMLASREVTLRAIRRAAEEASVFVFTMGLTEAWRNTADGYVYPMCPGTLHGSFDPSLHEFVNYRHAQILDDLRATIEMVSVVNSGVCFLLTVSPVPLTATASGDHVLVATTHSKSTLRSVAAELCEDARVDYFPSYEIVTGLPYRAMLFEGNLRSVSTWGVDFVMSHFFRAQAAKYGDVRRRPRAEAEESAGGGEADEPDDADIESDGEDEVVCEDALLEAFGGGRTP